MSVANDGDSIVLAVDDRTCQLSREQAGKLQDAVGDALTERREFVRTAGVYREDGSYEVTRRGSDSSGNAKVFPNFRSVERAFERLPETFTAEDVDRTGVTGSRRHLLVRHFAEHPAFGCRIARRNPLTAEKTPSDGGTADAPAD